MAGQILAGAVEEAARDGAAVLGAVQRAAAHAGHRLGAEQRRRATGTQAVPLEDLAAVFGLYGYEPRVEHGVLVLGNCPFHALAREHTALVCGMNLRLVMAMLDELGVQARLDLVPGRCCVTLTVQPE
ncbi:hypothetical protein [Pseudonocardia terrae]|uniref:hypothetical protein n=1 Tax=Pseudonocardia terrae TaxID=2905831 RepID=UPI0027E185E9|nr:hypothetical protein [Pseudonocardia terrae]